MTPSSTTISYMDLYDKNKALEKYVKYGGFAGSYVYEDDEDKTKYVSNVLNVVVLKDIRRTMRSCEEDPFADNIDTNRLFCMATHSMA